MSKVLILGVSGMLGGSLFRYATRQSAHEVVGTVRSKQAAKRANELGFSKVIADVDVSNEDNLVRAIRDIRPDYVCNCIGIIKQKKQAQLPIEAIEINSLLPHKLAAICDSVNAKLIHFSTDCVFSGSTGNYTEESIPDATDLYGRTKLLGEVDYGDHITLRTSIIGHEGNRSLSLVDWFLSQSGPIQGYSAAIFSGMPTVYVAEVLCKHIFCNNDLRGLFHLSVNPIDKCSLLRMIAKIYGKDIIINNYEGFNIDRSLDSRKLQDITQFVPESWHTLIEKMHDEYRQFFT